MKQSVKQRKAHLEKHGNRMCEVRQHVENWFVKNDLEVPFPGATFVDSYERPNHQVLRSIKFTWCYLDDNQSTRLQRSLKNKFGNAEVVGDNSKPGTSGSTGSFGCGRYNGCRIKVVVPQHPSIFN